MVARWRSNVEQGAARSNVEQACSHLQQHGLPLLRGRQHVYLVLGVFREPRPNARPDGTEHDWCVDHVDLTQPFGVVRLVKGRAGLDQHKEVARDLRWGCRVQGGLVGLVGLMGEGRGSLFQ